MYYPRLWLLLFKVYPVLRSTVTMGGKKFCNTPDLPRATVYAVAWGGKERGNTNVLPPAMAAPTLWPDSGRSKLMLLFSKLLYISM